MRTRLEIAAVLVAVVWMAVMSFQVQQAKRDAEAAGQVRDSLLMEVAAADAASNGWAVQFGVMEKDLLGKIARRDSLSALLARDLDRANARVRSLVEVVAVLKDSLVSQGTPGDTTPSGETTYTGELDDGLLRATWGFVPPELSLAYSVRVGLEIITSEGGGRWLVAARASDPRVSLSVPAFYFEPPEPLQKCTFGAKAKWFLFGNLTGVAARSIY